jgi:exonuclease III
VFEYRDIQFKYCETVCGVLKFPNGEIMNLLAVYRPPNLSKIEFTKELHEYVNELSLKESVLLVGDMNIDLLSVDSSSSEYQSMLSESFMMRCIFDVTREAVVENRISKTCIDHIYVRMSDCVSDSTTVHSCVWSVAIADHKVWDGSCAAVR